MRSARRTTSTTTPAAAATSTTPRISIYGFSHEGILFDLKNTKHLVLYGRNIIESLMVKEAKAFMAAVANGMRVTYIDPRASLTACKATRYWQVRPNSDYALNLAIIHEVLEQEAYDKEFVARFVSGMDYLREAVKETTPAWQESHTGLARRAGAHLASRRSPPRRPT